MRSAHRKNIFCWDDFFLDNVKWKNYEFLSSHHLRHDNLLSLRRIFLSCSNS